MKIVVKNTEIEVMERPYTSKEIEEKADCNGFVNGYIEIDLSDMIDNDFDDFLDLIADRLVGSPLLMEIDYKAVAVKDNSAEGCNNTVILYVSGNVSEII